MEDRVKWRIGWNGGKGGVEDRVEWRIGWSGG